MIEHAALSHAYLLTGAPEACEAQADKLTRMLLCSGANPPCGLCRDCRKLALGVHPDRIVIEPARDDKGKQKREIYVEQIRAIVASAATLPNEAPRKVYLIRAAGTMNASAQNALLKLLEEPPSFVAFLLIAEDRSQLLETVRSRCVCLRLGGAETALPPSEEALARAKRYLELAAAGSRSALLRFTQEQAELSGEELQDFVCAAQQLLSDRLCGRTASGGLARRELLRLTQLLRKCEEYLRFHVGGKHVLGCLGVETILK